VTDTAAVDDDFLDQKIPSSFSLAPDGSFAQPTWTATAIWIS
jgi:hypothetical protein